MPLLPPECCRLHLSWRASARGGRYPSCGAGELPRQDRPLPVRGRHRSAYRGSGLSKGHRHGPDCPGRRRSREESTRCRAAPLRSRWRACLARMEPAYSSGDRRLPLRGWRRSGCCGQERRCSVAPRCAHALRRCREGTPRWWGGCVARNRNGSTPMLLATLDAGPRRLPDRRRPEEPSRPDGAASRNAWRQSTTWHLGSSLTARALRSLLIARRHAPTSCSASIAPAVEPRTPCGAPGPKIKRARHPRYLFHHVLRPTGSALGAHGGPPPQALADPAVFSQGGVLRCPRRSSPTFANLFTRR